MSGFVQRRWQEAPVQPWLNGGGVSRELLAWPAGEAWRIRVGVANIDRSGPFSSYPGVTRWFSVLDGEGVVLHLPEGPRAMGDGDEACCFDGAAAPVCDLIGGPTLDLNLMLRAADGAMQRAMQGLTWHPEAAQCGLFTRVGGRVLVWSDGHASDGNPHDVAAMTLLWWSPAPLRLSFYAEPGAEPDPTTPAGWWLAATPNDAGVRP